MDQSPMPFSFSLESGFHQSISAPFKWENIPPFAVVTGLNGSGKSHLLSLLHSSLRQGVGPSGVPPVGSVRVAGLQLAPQDIAFHTSLSGLQSTPVGLAHLQQQAYETVELLRNPRANPRDEQSLAAAARRDRIAPLIADKLGLSDTSPNSFRGVDASRIEEALGLDYVVSHRTDLATASLELASLFAEYNIRALQVKIASDRPLADCYRECGVPPWDILTGVIRSAGLPYSCSPPSSELRHLYKLELIHDGGTKIVLAGLSSGEQAIVGIAVHLLLCGHGKLPKLILLDEPDAHLHTAVIPRFVQMLLGGLVRQNGSRVILTTHRPETIVSSPASAIFEMRRDGPRIFPVSSVVAVRTLTAGLFTISNPFRCVLVEDEDDKLFYDSVYRLAVEESAIVNTTSLVFQPASIGSRRAKESGGRTVVEHWSRKLADAGLTGLVVGLVDKDEAPSDEPGVHYLQRYSIENYLLDPIVVFAALLDRRAQPQVTTTMPVYYGGEGLLKILPQEDLQHIADTVIGTLKSAPDIAESDAKRVVRYSSGQEIVVPEWYFSARGKDIMSHFQSAYPRHNVFGVAPLIRAFTKARLIPQDLLLTLSSVAGLAPTTNQEAAEAVEA